MGNDLFNTIAKATGLPGDLIADELGRVLDSKGIARSDVTLDELRDVLADYLREVLVHAKEEFQDGVTIEEESTSEEL